LRYNEGTNIAKTTLLK